jgi:uncharacterized hydrophobic protein (TIGR00271 family)
MRAPIVSEPLLSQIVAEARLSGAFVLFMSMSGVLSTVALLTNSVPVLIGAMVVAPAFAPLGLVAFGVAAGRLRTALRGLGIGLLGLAMAFAFTMLTTALLNASGVIPADENLLGRRLLDERVRPGWYSILAAAAAGPVGTIGLIKNRTDTLVGTVASVALVPAGAAAGIAFISGDSLRALGGLILLGINISTIIGTALLTLAIVRPGAESGVRRPPA